MPLIKDPLAFVYSLPRLCLDTHSSPIEQMRSYVSRLFSLSSADPGLLRFDPFPVIHIAGTKGKGSTAAFCASILQAHGLSTGLFTSPHLMRVFFLLILKINERIQINRCPISDAEFLKALNDVRDRIAPFPAPTFFQFLALMAIHYFKEANV